MTEFKSLSKRLLIWQIILSVTTLAALCSVVYLFLAVTLDGKQELTLQQNIAVVEHLVREANKAQSTQELEHKLDDLLFANGDLSVSLRTAQGALLYQKERVSAKGDPLKKGALTVPTDRWGAVNIHVVLDIKADRELKEKFAWLLLAVALVGSVVVASFGFWLNRSGLKPLLQLTEQTQKISASDLGARLDGSAQPLEIQGLVAQFNALLARLQSSYEQMESFNANVAHELKNPVATLIASHEIALRNVSGQGAQAELLASNLEELQRIAGIVNDMLFMSRADSGVKARTEHVANLAEVMQAVADYYEASAEESSVALRVSGVISGSVDIGLFKRALSNLISNAIRYADKDSAIDLYVEPISSPIGWGRVSVRNTGASISQQDLPKLFDRFFRADSGRESSGSRHGLGLAIVSAVAKMHGGKSFAACEDRVVQVGFEFPLQ